MKTSVHYSLNMPSTSSRRTDRHRARTRTIRHPTTTRQGEEGRHTRAGGSHCRTAAGLGGRRWNDDSQRIAYRAVYTSVRQHDIRYPSFCLQHGRYHDGLRWFSPSINYLLSRNRTKILDSIKLFYFPRLRIASREVRRVISFNYLLTYHEVPSIAIFCTLFAAMLIFYLHYIAANCLVE